MYPFCFRRTGIRPIGEVEVSLTNRLTRIPTTDAPSDYCCQAQGGRLERRVRSPVRLFVPEKFEPLSKLITVPFGGAESG